MNLNTFGGYIRGGDYDVLIAHGNAAIIENVTFDTLVVKGILQTSICQGRRIVLDGGMLNSSGKIVADSLSGHGCICAQQHISSRNIAFIGEIETHSRLIVKESIQIKGSVKAESLIASKAKITGHANIQQYAETDRLEIAPLRTTMFERFGMNEYLEPNSVHRIEAMNVMLRDTICQKINAGYVSLSGSTQVEKVTYDGDLRLDRTSSVRIIEPRRKTDEDEGLQRKVA